MKVPGKYYTGPSQARLNNKPSASGVGAWVPGDVEGCLTIQFSKMEHVKEIRTQGHPTRNLYTKKYFLSASTDRKNFDFITRVSP